MRLAPRWTDRAVRAEAAAAWRTHRSLRIEGVLADDVVTTVRDAIAELTHPLIAAAAPDFAFQYGALTSPPEDNCDHVWCQFARWWWVDGRALVEDITGMRLIPPRDRALMSTLFRRGSFIDPHNDYDRARRCAYVLGLTDTTWPAELGGHLEFLAVEDGRTVVRERRAPGWNTLDLFDVSSLSNLHLHQVPILTTDVERRAITGWFF
ncbi:MAG: 2OG-Fe(II) oxygenase [Myxococcales bacterium]|nr:2OG-Fe(II) oxygenase [Myxococcales bacterium]